MIKKHATAKACDGDTSGEGHSEKVFECYNCGSSFCVLCREAATGDAEKCLTCAPPKNPKIYYPHTAWMARLDEESAVRAITHDEAVAITEVSIFETLIEGAIPELKKMMETLEVGSVERQNAGMYLRVASEFATGMARDVERLMKLTAIRPPAMRG